MGSTLLQLVTQVTSELGIPVPASVVGNVTQDTVQILALMNAVGKELLTEGQWRDLTVPYNFFAEYLTTTGTITSGSRIVTAIPSTAALDTTFMLASGTFPNASFIQSVDSSTQVTLTQPANSSGTAQTLYFQKAKYTLPADYESIVDRTQWDKSKHWEMLGPEDAQQWEWLLSGYISTGPRVRWRLFGSYFQIWPGFSNSEALGFEYRSLGWARSAAGVAQNSFQADTDTCIFPDRLMVLSTKVKYMESKGLPTQALYQDRTRNLETAIARDTGAANLSFAPRPGTVLIGYDNLPDSFPYSP